MIYVIKAPTGTLSSLSKLPRPIPWEAHCCTSLDRRVTVSDFLHEVSCLLLGLVLGGSSVAALEPFGANIIIPSAFLSSGSQ